jgi:hypothetical protein
MQNKSVNANVIIAKEVRKARNGYQPLYAKMAKSLERLAAWRR